MKKSSFLLFFLIVISMYLYFGCSDRKKPRTHKGPVYTAKKTIKAPDIDGVLNDQCWKDLDALNLVSSVDGSKAKMPTTVRAIWDDKYLYIGFECQDTDAASTLFQPDGDIKNGDYCTVCFNAIGDTTTYCQINIAPTGVINDAFIIVGRGDIKSKILTSWNCENTRSSVSVYGAGASPGNEDRFWTVEIAIPFTECLPAENIPPSPGDEWRINFFRYDITGGESWMAFSPTGDKNFDKPSAFAWLKFGN